MMKQVFLSFLLGAIAATKEQKMASTIVPEKTYTM
jgi:hypothetical protein